MNDQIRERAFNELGEIMETIATMMDLMQVMGASAPAKGMTMKDLDTQVPWADQGPSPLAVMAMMNDTVEKESDMPFEGKAFSYTPVNQHDEPTIRAHFENRDLSLDEAVSVLNTLDAAYQNLLKRYTRSMSEIDELRDALKAQKADADYEERRLSEIARNWMDNHHELEKEMDQLRLDVGSNTFFEEYREATAKIAERNAIIEDLGAQVEDLRGSQTCIHGSTADELCDRFVDSQREVRDLDALRDGLENTVSDLEGRLDDAQAIAYELHSAHQRGTFYNEYVNASDELMKLRAESRDASDALYTARYRVDELSDDLDKERSVTTKAMAKIDTLEYIISSMEMKFEDVNRRAGEVIEASQIGRSWAAKRNEAN